MKVCIKNIFSLFLLWLFLFPTTVQLNHHHDEEVDNHVVEGISFHTKHEGCQVCDFHFSLFSGRWQEGVYAPILITFEKLAIKYIEPGFCASTEVLSLRGPPSHCLV